MNARSEEECKETENTKGISDPRRGLPALNTLIEHPELSGWIQDYSKAFVTQIARDVLKECRSSLRPGSRPPSFSEVLQAVKTRLLEETHQRLRPVVNATGVVLLSLIHI